MLSKKTTIILGAGSSVEFKLPAGDGLARSIAERTYFWFDGASMMTSGDHDLYRALRNRFAENNAVLLAGRRISEGLPLSRSIDDYLYNHGHDPVVVHVGKAAIVRSILEAEAGSSLISFSGNEPRASARALAAHSDTWIQKVFSFIQTGVRLADVRHIFDGLSIINFNYDRCVEVYLYYALQAAYGIGRDEAAEVMSTLDITHPYGQVGRLPWQDPVRGIGFGDQPRDERILTLADGIKTFTEQAHDDAEKAQWRDIIGGCEQLLFLGFGFHRQNVDLLGLEFVPKSIPKVYATTFGASIEDGRVFKTRIHQLLKAPEPEVPYVNELPIELRRQTCAQMIGEYGLSLFS